MGYHILRGGYAGTKPRCAGCPKEKKMKAWQPSEETIVFEAAKELTATLFNEGDQRMNEHEVLLPGWLVNENEGEPGVDESFDEDDPSMLFPPQVYEAELQRKEAEKATPPTAHGCGEILLPPCTEA